MSINLINIAKKYEKQSIFENFNLNIEDGQTLAVMGKSGAGKTTLLAIIAGLTNYEGKVTGAEDYSFVFQEDRLIKHLTAEENLQFILDKKDYSMAREILEKVGMTEYDKYPDELSGGMAQRVSLARAFLKNSPLILLDEPFKNLDLGLKVRLVEMTKNFIAEREETAVIVTHDLNEAVMLADRIIVIDKGKIIFDKKSLEKVYYTLSCPIKEELYSLLLKDA